MLILDFWFDLAWENCNRNVIFLCFLAMCVFVRLRHDSIVSGPKSPKINSVKTRVESKFIVVCMLYINRLWISFCKLSVVPFLSSRNQSIALCRLVILDFWLTFAWEYCMGDKHFSLFFCAVWCVFLYGSIVSRYLWIIGFVQTALMFIMNSWYVSHYNPLTH